MHENFPSKDFFKINGVSSETVGIYVDTPPVPPMAHKKYTNYFYDVDDDYVYEDIKFTIRFFTFYNEDFDNSAIYAFLHNAETLEISRLSGYYYKIKDFEVQQPNVSYDGAKIEYQVDFTLEPFKYKTDNPEIELDTTSETTVINNGTHFCKPTFNISLAGDSGQTDVSIYVNDVEFKIEDVGSGNIVVDSETMTAIKKGNPDVNLLMHTADDFLYMHSGNNVAKCSIVNGTVVRFAVKLNERSF